MVWLAGIVGLVDLSFSFHFVFLFVVDGTDIQGTPAPAW